MRVIGSSSRITSVANQFLRQAFLEEITDMPFDINGLENKVNATSSTGNRITERNGAGAVQQRVFGGNRFSDGASRSARSRLFSGRSR